jgi:two-component system CheB/CheR fusion protein
LASIGEHSYLGKKLIQTEAPDVKKLEARDEDFRKLFAFLQETYGVNFGEYKPGTIQRRTFRRMALHKMDYLSDYLRYLEKNPTETEALFQDLLIPVTRFFRDPEAFEALKSKVFPAIVKDKNNKGTIRIWSAGCSTGEEVYSLAIVLLEFLGDKASRFQIQLFGTDVNDFGIEKARAGVYPERISKEVSAERLRQFFNKAETGYRISKELRDLCIFATQNLVEDVPFSKMNLVACRNVLIYLGPAAQRKIIPRLHYALRPLGFLMLGACESVDPFFNLFDTVDQKHKIFVKKAIRIRRYYDFSTSRQENIANRRG